MAKEGLVLEFFQNLLQAGGGKIWTIVIKLIQESHKHDKKHYKAPVYSQQRCKEIILCNTLATLYNET